MRHPSPSLVRCRSFPACIFKAQDEWRWPHPKTGGGVKIRRFFQPEWVKSGERSIVFEFLNAKTERFSTLCWQITTSSRQVVGQGINVPSDVPRTWRWTCMTWGQDWGKTQLCMKGISKNFLSWKKLRFCLCLWSLSICVLGFIKKHQKGLSPIFSLKTTRGHKSLVSHQCRKILDKTFAGRNF